VHRQEVLIDHAVVVEDGATHFRFGPGDGWLLRIHLIAPREGLVAIACGIEEVNAVPARRAVSRWVRVDGNTVIREDIGGVSDARSVVDPEGEVV